jgi:GNAT superfamily N-acetyltransferase
MATVYTVEPLPAEKVDQAYPLIQAIEPKLDLGQWRVLCRRLNDKRDGAGESGIVFVVVDATGYFRGICIVETTHEPANGPAIAISKLMIDDAIDPIGAASALLRALYAYAADHGCRRLRISMVGTDEAALAALGAARAALPSSPLVVEMK